jgi:hypothetical protein
MRRSAIPIAGITLAMVALSGALAHGSVVAHPKATATPWQWTPTPSPAPGHTPFQGVGPGVGCGVTPAPGSPPTTPNPNCMPPFVATPSPFVPAQPPRGGNFPGHVFQLTGDWAYLHGSNRGELPHVTLQRASGPGRLTIAYNYIGTIRISNSTCPFIPNEVSNHGAGWYGKEEYSYAINSDVRSCSFVASTVPSRGVYRTGLSTSVFYTNLAAHGYRH